MWDVLLTSHPITSHHTIPYLTCTIRTTILMLHLKPSSPANFPTRVLVGEALQVKLVWLRLGPWNVKNKSKSQSQSKATSTHHTLHTTHYTLNTTHYTLHTTHHTLHPLFLPLNFMAWFWLPQIIITKLERSVILLHLRPIRTWTWTWTCTCTCTCTWFWTASHHFQTTYLWSCRKDKFPSETSTHSNTWIFGAKSDPN